MSQYNISLCYSLALEIPVYNLHYIITAFNDLDFCSNVSNLSYIWLKDN